MAVFKVGCERMNKKIRKWEKKENKEKLVFIFKLMQFLQPNRLVIQSFDESLDKCPVPTNRHG